MQQNLRVAVIGGSITGPALAAILQRDGVDVRIFDRTPSAVPTNQGGGVIFLNLGTLEVLDELDIDRSTYVDFPSPAEEVIEFKILPDRKLTPGRTLHYPRQASQWRKIHQALESTLRPGTVSVGRRVVGIRRSEWGVEIRFSDNTWDWADLVVFADGRSSTGRKILQPERPLIYDGWVIHRGIHLNPPPAEGHFVRYFTEQGLFNTYAVRNDDGILGTYWEFDLNTTEEQFIDEFGADPHQRAFMLPSHVSQRSRERVRDIAAHFLPAALAALTEPWQSRERMAAPMFTITDPTHAVHKIGERGYAVLLGDALAPQFPMTGRGANDGIEEAASLARTIRQVALHGHDLDAALEGWEERVLVDVAADLAKGKDIARKRHLGGGELPLDLLPTSAI